MGFHGSHNSNLTPTGMAHKLIGEIMFLSDMLLDLDLQRIIKEYCNAILQHRSAISDTTNLLPLEAALLIIVAEQDKNKKSEVNKLYNEFNQRIKDLEGGIEEVKKLLDETT
jgi:hypothetical protein